MIGPLTALWIALLLGLSAPASAATCGPRDDMIAWLGGFGEQLVAQGIVKDDLMEVYAAPDTRTWSITVTRGSGLTCLVAAGRDFEPLTIEPVGAPL